MYKLNPNSLTSRFYSWLWDVDVRKFRNMCPYFWKYVLTIIFLPFLLVGKLIMSLLPESEKADRFVRSVANSKVGTATGNFFDWVGGQTRFWDTVGVIFKWIFMGLLGIMVALGAAGFIYMLFIETIKALAILGGITGLVGVTALLVWLFAEKNLGTILWSPFKLVGNMAYNLYKGMCPILTWEK